MKTKLRIAAIAVLACVFVVSAANIIRINYDYAQADKMTSEAEEKANVPELKKETEEPVQTQEQKKTDPYLEQMKQIDITALKQEGADVVGWIIIPDSGISYPVVHGEDNDFYLTHSWKGVRNGSGSIFMDCWNTSDMTDFNTLMYGHRMNNDGMFGLLHNYEQENYWVDHPRIYYRTETAVYAYEVFAACQSEVAGATYTREFPDEQSRIDYIDAMLEQSSIDTGIVPTSSDRILTLSTCMYRNRKDIRWIVQGVLAESESTAGGASDLAFETETVPQT